MILDNLEIAQFMPYMPYMPIKNSYIHGKHSKEVNEDFQGNHKNMARRRLTPAG